MKQAPFSAGPVWTDSLLEQLAELDHLYRTAPVGLCLLTPEFRFQRVNQRLAEIAGRPVAVHVGRTLREILPNLASALEGALRHVVATGETVRELEVDGTTAAQLGEERRWLVSFYPMVSEAGSVSSISAVFHEVTELKRAEEALQEAHDLLEKRVEERTQELQEANVRLREEIRERKKAHEESRRHREELAHVSRVTTVGELAASLAHELNQPLSAILSNAQAARRFLDRELPVLDEVGGALDDIAKDVQRAGEVIRRLRRLLRKEEPERKRLEVNEVIHEVVALVHSDLVGRNISMKLELAAGLPPISGDRIQLQQVVLNLLLNGSEAMSGVDRNSRQMVIRTSQEDPGTVTVAVRDSGTGIEEEMTDLIFDAFYTTRESGLGMGLSISRSILESHGGRLWAERNHDSGATFLFTLPAAVETADG